MKELRKTGCSFFVDYEKNAAYNTAKERVMTPYWRNFNSQMRFYSPELNEFFDDFAIDIVKPESLTWEEHGDELCYEAKYLCKGTMSAESYSHNVRKVVLSAKPLDEGTVEFTMSNLYLPVVVLELKQQPEKPKGVFARLFGK